MTALKQKIWVPFRWNGYIQDILKSRINDKFQVIKLNPVNLA